MGASNRQMKPNPPPIGRFHFTVHPLYCIFGGFSDPASPKIYDKFYSERGKSFSKRQRFWLSLPKSLGNGSGVERPVWSRSLRKFYRKHSITKIGKNNPTLRQGGKNLYPMPPKTQYQCLDSLPLAINTNHKSPRPHWWRGSELWPVHASAVIFPPKHCDTLWSAKIQRVLEGHRHIL